MARGCSSLMVTEALYQSQGNETINGCGCVVFSITTCGYSMPQKRQFCRIVNVHRQKIWFIGEIHHSLPHNLKPYLQTVGDCSDDQLALDGAPIEFLVWEGLFLKINSGKRVKMVNCCERCWVDVDGCLCFFLASAAIFPVLELVYPLTF